MPRCGPGHAPPEGARTRAYGPVAGGARHAVTRGWRQLGHRGINARRSLYRRAPAPRRRRHGHRGANARRAPRQPYGAAHDDPAVSTAGGVCRAHDGPTSRARGGARGAAGGTTVGGRGGDALVGSGAATPPRGDGDEQDLAAGPLNHLGCETGVTGPSTRRSYAPPLVASRTGPSLVGRSGRRPGNPASVGNAPPGVPPKD